MNSLGAIAFGVGLQDGLNPCMFMTCAFFIIHGIWIKAGSLPVFWFRCLFVLLYAFCALVYNFGPVQNIVFNQYFILATKIVNFAFGVGTFVLGIIFFRNWNLISHGMPAKDFSGAKTRTFPGYWLVALLITVVLILVFSAIAAIWPINPYFMLLGNEAIIKGQWHMVIPDLVVYTLSTMWPLWLLWAFISIKGIRPSLLSILYATIFFTASTTVIFIFK